MPRGLECSAGQHYKFAKPPAALQDGHAPGRDHGGIGLATGSPAAWAASRLVKSFLYGIKADDPSSIAAAVVTMAIAVLVAGYAPALRASRIDPVNALRSE